MVFQETKLYLGCSVCVSYFAGKGRAFICDLQVALAGGALQDVGEDLSGFDAWVDSRKLTRKQQEAERKFERTLRDNERRSAKAEEADLTASRVTNWARQARARKTEIRFNPFES